MRRIGGRRGRRGLVFSGIAIAALALAGAAFAFFVSTDSSNPAAAVADSIQAGNTPTLGGINGQDVTLNWTATTTASGASVTGYTINRYSVSSGGTPTAATGGCSGTVSALTCTEQSVPAGTWYYAVTPKISLWAGTESGRLSTSVVTASFTVTANQFVRATANVAGGAIAHFKNSETVVFHLDSSSGTTMTGSISAVNSSGSASAFTVTVPAGTAQGSHTIVAVGGSGSQATSNSFTVDNTAPSGGSVTYNNAYFTTASIQVTFSNGTDTGGSGINTATTQLQRASATLSAGACGSFGSFGPVGSAGQGSPYTDTSVASGSCYQYQYVVSDNAGNTATYTSASVAKVDTAAPSGGSVTYTTGYYTAASIQVTFSNGTDTGGSGLNTATTQLQRASATLSAGACGSFGSFGPVGSAGQGSPYTDTSVASGSCYQYQYVVSDNAGNTATYTSASVAKVDTAAPSGGSVTYNNAYFASASVSVTLSNGTDTGGSGINTATTQLQRASATLSAGSCGTFSSFTNVGSAGPASPYADTSVVGGNCYMYQYLVSDNAGNTATYTTANVAKVDTTAPVFTITTSGANIYASGLTVLFKNTGTNTFTVTASDPESGVTSSSFGTTPTGWTVSGSGNARTYTRSTANASSTLGVSATNGAGTVFSPTVTITFDNVKPVATDVQLANGPGTAGTLDQGDTLTITYSEQLNAASLCSIWNNNGVQTVNDATVSDGKGAGGSLTVSSASCGTFNFGTVVTNGAYSNPATTFTNSTITWDPTALSLTITIGTQASGTVATGVTAATPKYTAATAITDLVGNTITTTAVNGSTTSRF